LNKGLKITYPAHCYIQENAACIFAVHK